MNMEREPRLSVIIVNYNSAGYLQQCLSSLFADSLDLGVEVIVVDNCSTDGSAESISKFGERVRLISNRQNLGFAGGCNRGLAASSGEYVLFLNPDIEIRSGALDRMISFMEANQKAGLLAPKICLPNGEFQTDSVGPFPSILHVLLFRSSLGTALPFVRRLVYRKYLNPEGAYEVDWATGACLLGRRELLVKLRGFDQDYFMYFEDTDLCYRARRAGARVFFYSGAEILHHHGRSCQDQQMLENIWRRGLYLFFKKNRGLLYALASMATAAFIMSVKLVLLYPVSVLAPKSERLRAAVDTYLAELGWHLNPKNVEDLVRS